jgi:hypothetical protein
MADLSGKEVDKLFIDSFEAMWQRLEETYSDFTIIERLKPVMQTVWMDGAGAGMEYAKRLWSGDIRVK